MKKMIIAACAVFALTSCSDFLEETPVGELTPEQAQDPNNIEGLIISAYSILDGQMDDASSGLNSGCSNWQFGDVISDDTYKGGGGTGRPEPGSLDGNLPYRPDYPRLQSEMASLIRGREPL